MSRSKIARRFKAKSNDGKQYIVIEYQFYDVILTGGNTVSKIDGLKKWKTTTGLLLNETNEPKVFRVAATNEIITEN